MSNLKNKNLVFKPELEKNLRAYLRKYYTEEVIKKLERLMIKSTPVDITVKDLKDRSFFKKELGASSPFKYQGCYMRDDFMLRHDIT